MNGSLEVCSHALSTRYACSAIFHYRSLSYPAGSLSRSASLSTLRHCSVMLAPALLVLCRKKTTGLPSSLVKMPRPDIAPREYVNRQRLSSLMRRRRAAIFGRRVVGSHHVLGINFNFSHGGLLDGNTHCRRCAPSSRGFPLLR